jgi:hypothetical protein
VTIRRPTRDELTALCRRLDSDYRERFLAFGGGFDAWANGANIAGEAAFGGSAGPMWGAVVRYARRTGWAGLFGPLVSFRTIEDAESELRKELDLILDQLKAGIRPRSFGGPR